MLSFVGGDFLDPVAHWEGDLRDQLNLGQAAPVSDEEESGEEQQAEADDAESAACPSKEQGFCSSGQAAPVVFGELQAMTLVQLQLLPRRKTHQTSQEMGGRCNNTHPSTRLQLRSPS